MTLRVVETVASKQYIHELKQVILRLHNVSARWVESAPVEIVYEDQTLWRGTVEVFEVINHPKAKRAYAWSRLEPESERTGFVAVLEIPPVVSPETAVKTSLAADAKEMLRKAMEDAAAEIARRNQRN
ncbi:MAG TPA: hypothetical protein VFZ59_20875 [Verrucomicrobiae bacterium]|nr:hypothetical protein [Verrucomicrobiae bacterium]